MFYSTKTFSHSLGLSAAFRQWRAKSHCRFLHGYALEIRIEFAAEELDDLNWVVDFGSLKTLKSRLENTFDHKTVVAKDDPLMSWFEEGERLGLLELMQVEATGCEKFAELVYDMAWRWLADSSYFPRVDVHSVEVREHGANSAIFRRSPPRAE